MYSTEWFKSQVEPMMVDYQVKYVTGEGDFGELDGVQFDSETNGGYLYFWSLNYVAFELIDYSTGEDIIEDTLIEVAGNEKLLEEKLALLRQAVI